MNVDLKHTGVLPNTYMTLIAYNLETIPALLNTPSSLTLTVNNSSFDVALIGLDIGTNFFSITVSSCASLPNPITFYYRKKIHYIIACVKLPSFLFYM